VKYKQFGQYKRR